MYFNDFIYLLYAKNWAKKENFCFFFVKIKLKWIKVGPKLAIRYNQI